MNNRAEIAWQNFLASHPEAAAQGGKYMYLMAFCDGLISARLAMRDNDINNLMTESIYALGLEENNDQEHDV